MPVGVKDVPITLSKMLREDGSYHTINTLQETLGHLFVPTPIIDERFIVIHYSFARNGEDALFTTFLESNGLVNMRTSLADVSAIDFTKLKGIEFGIFSALEIQSVPQVQSAV